MSGKKGKNIRPGQLNWWKTLKKSDTDTFFSFLEREFPMQVFEKEYCTKPEAVGRKCRGF